MSANTQTASTVLCVHSHAFRIVCLECDGSGEVEQNHDGCDVMCICGECDGKGTIDASSVFLDEQPVKLVDALHISPPGFGCHVDSRRNYHLVRVGAKAPYGNDVNRCGWQWGAGCAQ